MVVSHPAINWGPDKLATKIANVCRNGPMWRGRDLRAGRRTVSMKAERRREFLGIDLIGETGRDGTAGEGYPRSGRRASDRGLARHLAGADERDVGRRR